MNNLLAQEEKIRIKKEYHFRVAGLFLVLSAVTGFLGSALLVPAYFLAHSREQFAEIKKAQFGKLPPDDEKIFVTLKQLQNTILFLKPEEEIPFSETVGLLLAYTKRDITLSTLNFARNGSKTHVVSLKGFARTRESLLDFSKTLRSLEHISGVEIPVSSFAQERDISFSTTVTVDYQ